MTNTLALASKLIAQPSITPDDAQCQNIISDRLASIGFNCQSLQFGAVKNLWAKRRGKRKLNIPGKTLVFAGHTDVVPTGPIDQWTSNPFQPDIRNGYLYGRGAADMKTSIAAFVVATEEFVLNHPNHFHDIAFLITSDEEGEAINGTTKVLEHLAIQKEIFHYCIIGEPSSKNIFGDTIKNGRRGSMNGKLTILGQQGHIAYPHLAKNPIHMLAPALHALSQYQWGGENQHFPSTSWQVSNIHGGTGASNVIPATINLDFNFRFSNEHSPEDLKKKLTYILKTTGITDKEFIIQWHLSGLPFLTRESLLSDILKNAILKETGVATTLSTDGGTSDGRFIAKYCSEVLEFGPCNDSIHKIDENIEISTIESLKNIYRRVLEQLITYQSPAM